jgi:hypothetical protein
MSLANKIGWVGIAFALLTSGVLAQDFPRRPAGSDSNKEGVPESHQNEIKKMQETLRNKGTTEARSMASLVWGPEPVFARIKRLKICLSPGSWIPRRPVNSESDQWVARNLATRLQRGNLRQA